MAPKPLTFFQYILLYIVQRVIATYLLFSRLLKSDNRPTYTKAYECRPKLSNRVFLPPGLTRGLKATKKYPLFIEIHGGGFATFHPCADDAYCALIAEKCSAIVVAIKYSKTPQVQYPIPSNDCIAIVNAILADAELPIDHDKVVIGGMSAGGTLAMSIAQNKSLRDRFKAMVIWYPFSDFTVSLEQRLDFRPKTDKEDLLAPAYGYLLRAYAPSVDNLKDPNISPYYADVRSFPKKALFIAAENDILQYDTHIMAQKLAGDAPKVDDEGNNDEMTGWTADHTTYCLVHHQSHGFNQNPTRGEAEVIRKKVKAKVDGKITRWLREEVFSVAYV